MKFAIIAIATGLAFVLARWCTEKFVSRIEHEDPQSRAQDRLDADKASVAQHCKTGERDR
jgi:hypothetical protein